MKRRRHLKVYTKSIAAALHSFVFQEQVQYHSAIPDASECVWAHTIHTHSGRACCGRLVYRSSPALLFRRSKHIFIDARPCAASKVHRTLAAYVCILCIMQKPLSFSRRPCPCGGKSLAHVSISARTFLPIAAAADALYFRNLGAHCSLGNASTWRNLPLMDGKNENCRESQDNTNFLNPRWEIEAFSVVAKQNCFTDAKMLYSCYFYRRCMVMFVPNQIYFLF
jgi:hypothetical protein